MPDRRRQQLRIREEISSTEEHAWPAARLTSVLMPATRRENQLRCQWAGSPDPHPASIPDCRCSFCTVLAPSRARVRGPGTQGTAHSRVLAGQRDLRCGPGGGLTIPDIAHQLFQRSCGRSSAAHLQNDAAITVLRRDRNCAWRDHLSADLTTFPAVHHRKFVMRSCGDLVHHFAAPSATAPGPC